MMPCPVCKTPMKRTKKDGRVTYECEKCGERFEMPIYKREGDE